MVSREVRKLVEDALSNVFSEALKTNVRLIPPLAKDILLDSPTVAYYQVTGGFSGDIAFFFPESSRKEIVDIFSSRVLGANYQDVPGGLDSLCLEIANIALGHLTGKLSDQGYEMGIADPGLALTGSDFAKEAPSFQSETDKGFLLGNQVEIEDKHADIAVWFNLSAAEIKTGDVMKSVLIVDDSAAMRAFLEKVFRENGYTIAGVAADGVEAIEKFESTNPDLVTLDIIMPKMKGTEVLERIMERNPAAKVVMASSVSDARTVMKCLKIGAKRYIIKPYDENAVLEAVEKALGLSPSK